MLQSRGDLEAREAAALAPYAMRAADSRGRVRPEAEAGYRTAYQRDRDRIIHSSAFRRLEYKTQVFVNDEGDYYRTRLTHTLEVAQIARTVGRALGLNEDLIEAIALAHDLGHAPFGHSGGDALAACMRGFGGFEHNRQSLRIVDRLERRYPGFRGLNLSYEVRESIVKHGEAAAAAARPEHAEFDPGTSPLLEGQLVDLCDEIAYDAADIDDGIRAGLIDVADLEELSIWRRSVELAGAGDPRSRALAPPSTERRLAVVSATRALIDVHASDLADATARRLERERVRSTADVRARRGYLVGFSEAVAAEKRAVEEFLRERLYRHHRVMRMRRKAERMITRLFETYAGAPEMLPPEWRAWCEEEGVERAVCDYIAGMTDRYAQQEYARLLAPFERT